MSLSKFNWFDLSGYQEYGTFKKKNRCRVNEIIKIDRYHVRVSNYTNLKIKKNKKQAIEKLILCKLHNLEVIIHTNQPLTSNPDWFFI